MPFDEAAIPFIIFVLIFIPIGLIETILSIRWAPFYMRYSIPFLQQSKPLLKEQFDKAAAQMDRTELSNKWLSTIVFRQISPSELAFQRKPWELSIGFRSRLPIRGIVKLEQGQSTVKVIQYLPWSTLIALLFFLALLGPFYLQMPQGGGNLLFLAFFLLILFVGLGWQFILLQRVNQRILERFIKASQSYYRTLVPFSESPYQVFQAAYQR